MATATATRPAPIEEKPPLVLAEGTDLDEGVIAPKVYKNVKGMGLTLRLVDRSNLIVKGEPRLRLVFKNVTPDDETNGINVSCLVTPTISYGKKESNLAKVQQGLMGKPLKEGEKFNIPALIEAEATMLADVKVRKTDAGTWSNIDFDSIEPAS